MKNRNTALGKRRVWEDDAPTNRTEGLVRLCQDWIHREYEIAEIGCFAGASTMVFALYARKVWGIDPYEKACEYGYVDISREMLILARSDMNRLCQHWRNIEHIDDLSTVASARFGDCSLDAVYLDGDHRPEMIAADVRAWRRKVKPGGLLMGHDAPAMDWHYVGLEYPVRVYPDSSWVCRTHEYI